MQPLTLIAILEMSGENRRIAGTRYTITAFLTLPASSLTQELTDSVFCEYIRV